MRAVRAHEYGGPEVLRVDEVPEPSPLPGQAVLKIEAAGVNFGEMSIFRGGHGGELPMMLGFEGGGVVTAIGEGVKDVRVGERVLMGGTARVTFAEYAAGPADKMVPIPNNTDTKTAVATFMQGRTAHYLALDAYPIQPGDTVLIHSAAGGVGGLLTQIAKRQGAYVIGTTSTEEKARYLEDIGADKAIVYTREDVVEEVLKATNGQGVRVVYDGIGKATMDASIRCTARRGFLITYGETSGPPPPVDISLAAFRSRGSIYINKSYGDDYRTSREEWISRAHDVFRWISEGDVRVHIHGEYPFEAAGDAFRDLAGGNTIGKLLLVP